MALALEVAMVAALGPNAAPEEVLLKAELKAKVLELERSSAAQELERSSAAFERAHLPLPPLLLLQQLLQQPLRSGPLAQQGSAWAAFVVVPNSSGGASNDACRPRGPTTAPALGA